MIIFFLCVCCFSGLLFAQNIMQGETITLVYKGCSNSQLTAEDAFVNVEVRYEDASYEYFHISLKKSNDYKSDFFVPENASVLFIRYYRSNCTNDWNYFPVFRKDGYPAKLSKLYAVFQDDKLDINNYLEEELSYYPDNLTALLVAASIVPDFSLINENYISHFKILNFKNKQLASKLHFETLLSAHALDINSCVNNIYNLLQNYPSYPLLSSVVTSFTPYIKYSDSLRKQYLTDYFQDKVFGYIKKHPTNYQAGELINYGYFSNGSIDDVKTIIGRRIEEATSPDVIYGNKLSLLRVLTKSLSSKDIDHAIDLGNSLLQDVNLFHYAFGDTLFYHDLRNHQIKVLLAQAHKKKGDLGKFLQLSFEAKNFLLNPLYVKRQGLTDFNLNVLNKNIIQAYIEADLIFLAEELLISILKKESKDQKSASELKPLFQMLYQRIYGSLSGFEDYYTTLEFSKNLKSSEEKEYFDLTDDIDNSGEVISNQSTLPDFTLKTLDYGKFNLSENIGRVIVLNFWDLTCMPCITEISELNEVVKHFSDNKKVVFLAPTMNNKEKLEFFLQKKSFLYRVTYDDEATFKTFDLKGWPWHIVIDKNGNILLKQFGATADIKNTLINVIEKALDK